MPFRATLKESLLIIIPAKAGGVFQQPQGGSSRVLEIQPNEVAGSLSPIQALEDKLCAGTTELIQCCHGRYANPKRHAGVPTTR